MEGYVRFSIDKGLATLRFHHPSHNALPGYILSQLAEQIESLGQRDDVGLIALRSEGEKTFCAGASFDELLAIRDADGGKQFFSGFARVILAMKNCPKLIVALVHARAIGGGVGLAAAADYVIATRDASIRLSELAIGIGPFVIGPVVEYRIGRPAFQKLSLTPDEWQTASWAGQHGLFHEVFESKAQAEAYFAEFTGKLLSFNPQALTELKEIFWQGCDHWEQLLYDRAAISGKLILSDFSRRTLAALKAKT
ncbi:MAG: 1,4-dihydroxy-2-naphthoyl-CoA synthase [Saprospiraceae bacterium]|jgi:methylglutaconyl-CoA hydratase|nr:1,4-dihydroxy-2-naphthoyl-CoA synthase [Saprospiraceae bacterium]